MVASKKSGSGSGLFLMEMMMVVLFFILCASICILVFVKANRMSIVAQDTNQSVLMSQSIAESIKAEGTDILETDLGAVKTEAGAYQMFWDKNWQSVSLIQDSHAQATVRITENGLMRQIDIVIQQGNEVLYSLTTKQYQKP